MPGSGPHSHERDAWPLETGPSDCSHRDWKSGEAKPVGADRGCSAMAGVDGAAVPKRVTNRSIESEKMRARAYFMIVGVSCC